jgi:hypothetical protein
MCSGLDMEPVSFLSDADLACFSAAIKSKNMAVICSLLLFLPFPSETARPDWRYWSAAMKKITWSWCTKSGSKPVALTQKFADPSGFAPAENGVGAYFINLQGELKLEQNPDSHFSIFSCMVRSQSFKFPVLLSFICAHARAQ